MARVKSAGVKFVKRAAVCVAIGVLIFLAATGIVTVISVSGPENPETFAQSVVEIRAEADEPNAIAEFFGIKNAPKIHVIHKGTGFAVNGRIYTCEHVIHGSTEISVTLNCSRRAPGACEAQPAKLIRSNEKIDLAELKIEHPPHSLTLRSYPPRWLESVWQIGNPGPLAFVITAGRFAATDGKMNFFILDTFFGNSGSPIMDSKGQVIGMTHLLVEGTRFTGGGTLAELRAFIYPGQPQ